MTSEMRFVQEVEKHECLYNTRIPEYNRKDLTEAAWLDVCSQTDLTVIECKEKWRNIRSSLLRSLKPSEKVKKPYYLSPFLQFVMPFMRPLYNVEQKDDSCNTNYMKDNDYAEVIMCAVKTENEEDAETVAENKESSDETYNDPLSSQCSSPVSRKKRRHANKKIKIQKRKKYKPTESNNTPVEIEPNFSSSADLPTELPRSSNESTKYFLTSLVPELDTMTDEQLRIFKIKVMMLVHEIKSDFQKTKSTVSPSDESARLQKRLINLLLKNLAQQTSSTGDNFR